jgi:protocatechuate 3,4-dioxygenase beta subunit
VALVATAPGHGGVTSPVVRTVAGSMQLDLTLTAARWLEVRVLSERDAAPLPLAEVQIRRPDLAFPDVRTDPDGRARVGPVREGDTLQVSAEGHAPQRREVPSAGELEVRLTPGLPIAGRVVDENGVPVVGVGVRMLSEEYETAFALTGLDGTFRTPGVSPGTWNLRVSKGETRASVDVEAGTLDVELRLAKASEPLLVLRKDLVHVRVSTASGAPALSGHVALVHAGESAQAGLWEGRAALRLPRHANRSPFHVVVWGARDQDGVVQGPTSAGPFPASEREVEVTLRPPLTLMGWLQGLPQGLAGGVVVEAYPYLESWGGADFLRAAPADLEGLKLPKDAKLSARCLADGSFRIDGLADMPFALVALLPPGWVQDDEVVAEPGDVVKLKVSRGVDVVVTVLGGTGEPLPGAQVRAYFDVDHPPHESPLWNAHSTTSERRTDAQGRLRLRGLRPDEVYALSVEPPDKALHFKHYEKEWAPRDTTVRLRPAYVVEGTVRDAAGKPVEEAAVALWVTQADRVERKFAITDERGRFSFGTLPAGPYQAQAARSYEDLPDEPGPEASVLAAGTRDAVFVIDPGVSLLLQPASKGPSAFRKVLVYVREGASLREVRDELQRFGDEPTLLRGLAPGLRYVVWIPPDEQDPRYGLLEEVDPAAGPAVVALRDGATLRLRVEGLSEQPELEWGTASSDAGLELRLRPDAQGHVRGFPPGLWSLRGRLRGSGWGELVAAVEVGASDLDVTLRPK